jgi:hypothetical protein
MAVLRAGPDRPERSMRGDRSTVFQSAEIAAQPKISAD